jgi:CHAD domain-containing protein
MRRLRSAFTFFRPVIADEEFLVLREEVRWFTNQLGEARNLDVLLKRISAGKGADAAATELRETLQAARERAYASVLAALGSARLMRLMLDLVGWIETGAWRGGEIAGQPLAAFGRMQLDKRWRKVKKGGRRMAELETEPLHRLRIEVKKLRYAVEFLASLETRVEAVGRRKLFAAALEDMQEHLGELNDVETAKDLLDDLLRDRANAEQLLKAAKRHLEKGAAKDDPVDAAGQAYRQLAEAGPFWR